MFLGWAAAELWIVLIYLPQSSRNEMQCAHQELFNFLIITVPAEGHTV